MCVNVNSGTIIQLENMSSCVIFLQKPFTKLFKPPFLFAELFHIYFPVDMMGFISSGGKPTGKMVCIVSLTYPGPVELFARAVRPCGVGTCADTARTAAIKATNKLSGGCLLMLHPDAATTLQGTRKRRLK
jgi:hypothetical protein